MKVLELFLKETTEEDRAILSLSSAISNYIKKYRDIDPEQDHYDSNYDADYDDLDIHGDEDRALYIGTIGQLFDTPLKILDPVSIELQSDYGIRQQMKKNGESQDIASPNKKNVIGLWDIDYKTIILNKDYLGTLTIRSSIAHELRHALDDFKSDFKANAKNTKYTLSKIKSIRKLPDDDEEGARLKYLSEPAEINARFSQVLHDMLPVIERSVKLTPENAENLIKKSLKDKLDYYSITDFFPHKENSKEYKRFIKRAMDFIQKEKKYQEGLLKSKKV